MLRSLSSLKSVAIADREGELGAVGDILFDDGGWTIRYLVVDDGGPVPDNAHIIPPIAIDEDSRTDEQITLALTRRQVRNSLTLAENEPVSRQQEEKIHSYFGWQPYWTEDIPEERESPPVPQGDQMTGDRQAESVPQDEPEGTPHLRSGREIIGYHVEANGGLFGLVYDLILYDETWVIRYVVLDAGDEGIDRKLLLAAALIDSIRFDEYAVFIDLEADRIAGSPEYDPTVPLNEEYEEVLQDYFGY